MVAVVTLQPETKKLLLVTFIVAAIIGATVLLAVALTPEQRPVDEKTHACGCDHPDYEEILWLQKGVFCERAQDAISMIIEPRNMVIPPELSWISYGMHPTIPPMSQFWMGGTPDVVGTYLVSFDVLPLGHVHLTFVIWE